ncbi:MAG TPA: hypothetical protein VG838_15975 [Opitutaceae bacterium]|nr:hypothetical protein [Opitutaceae bacterium]
MTPKLPPQLRLPAALSVALMTASIQTTKATLRLTAGRRRGRRGQTLKPGLGTPLWNELCRAVRTRLRRHGEKARLGRLLGLPRQRVHELLMSRRHLPDAERTLLLLVWLGACEEGRLLT